MKKIELVQSKLIELEKDIKNLESQKALNIIPIKTGKKFIGINITNGNKPKYINTYYSKGNEISKQTYLEILNKNKLELTRLNKEIEEKKKQIEDLNKRLIEVKNDELLNSKDNKREKIDDNILISDIIKVVLSDSIKRYSLRELGKLLNLDYSTISNKFNNEKFRSLLQYNLFLKIEKIKKPIEKDRLIKFDDYLKDTYENRNNNFNRTKENSDNSKALKDNKNNTYTNKDEIANEYDEAIDQDYYNEYDER